MSHSISWKFPLLELNKKEINKYFYYNPYQDCETCVFGRYGWWYPDNNEVSASVVFADLSHILVFNNFLITQDV